MAQMMQLGAKGKALMQSFEALKLAAYQDQRGVWTIGWGHTGPAVGPQSVCTPEMADEWFAQDALWASKTVLNWVDVPLTQNQFDALVSFTFNVGASAFRSSTLCRYVNAGLNDAAAAEFDRWDHVDGKTNDGLQRRRAAERALYVSLD